MEIMQAIESWISENKSSVERFTVVFNASPFFNKYGGYIGHFGQRGFFTI